LGALDGKGHSDVTSFSPGGSPGVSDDSVGDSVFLSVTNGSDGVIEVRSFSAVVEDTTGVTLEIVVGSIDGNASWSSGDGGFQGVNTVVLDSSVGCSFDLSLEFFSIAMFTSLGSVWVSRFELHSVGSSINESLSLKSTIAPTVLLIAINELLFSELEKCSGLDEMSTLHGSSGGKGPAGTALSLVLNWVDSSFKSPVN
jgi:hypothetical protein